ncbi:VOC family protein [Streptomyces sp. NPDC050560]|uniref:VOC family protein n=1 Tax=Streptomyces sp. NPDC050560 TaxID=3365630 RepID=UPI0037A8C759
MTDNSARLDHVVLWVRDPVAAAEFYSDALGCTPLRLVEYTAQEVSFPSARLNDETILDLAPLDMAPRMHMVPGADRSAGHPVNHICLAVPAAEFDRLRARLTEQDVPMSEVSENSFGARGNAVRSFYFPDPDGNVFEVRHYDPVPTEG